MSVEHGGQWQLISGRKRIVSYPFVIKLFINGELITIIIYLFCQECTEVNKMLERAFHLSNTDDHDNEHM